MDFIKELQWRGLVHDATPGVQEKLSQEMTSGYVGFDPTASSLQIGNLAAIMLLVHFQRAGHKPIALVGGATGMVGDPSGKSQERTLMSIEEIQSNLECFKKQLRHFLDFDSELNAAEIVNNYDWFKDVTFIDFIRDIGKYLTVSYMMAKDSVQQRLESGLSFTEFSYQLLQGYDFYWLNKNKNCLIQMGGSDQWGNITTGTELIRKKTGNEVYALTCPLVTKEDGTKFGKSESGTKIWLDSKKTSPYKFYQFWLNCSDEEVTRYLKIFSLLSAQEISNLENEHIKAPHNRLMQKTLAKDLTIRIHSESDYQTSLEATQILFGKGTADALKKLKEKDFLEIFEGVPKIEISKTLLESGTDIITFLYEYAKIFTSKGEVRRLIKNRGLSINKKKIISSEDNINID